jgi:hypothetical protein
MASLTYYPSIPQPGDLPSGSQSQILQNFTSIGTWVTEDHFGFGTGTDGEHQQVTLPVPLSSDPGATGNVCVLYTKLASGNPQLFFQTAQGVLELTGDKSGQVTNANPGSVSMFGGIYLKWGPIPTAASGSVSFVSAFPNACYVVTASQNTTGTTRGTLLVSGFSTSGFSYRNSGSGTVSGTYIAIGW